MSEESIEALHAIADAIDRLTFTVILVVGNREWDSVKMWAPDAKKSMQIIDSERPKRHRPKKSKRA